VHHQFYGKHIYDATSIQQRCLTDYIQRNKTTEFGQQHHFGNIKNYKDFAKYVPIIEDYEVLRPFMNDIAAGKLNILTQEKTLFLNQHLEIRRNHLTRKRLKMNFKKQWVLGCVI
jgi:hypothetical protein